MKILAIDPGTQCGFALLDESSIVSGVWDLSVKRDESRGMRLIRLRNKLNEVGKVDILVFEVSKSHMSSLAAEVAGEIRGTITTWCIDNNVEYKGVHYTVIKKHATGKGNANKKLMVEAAEKKFNKTNLQHDEADALLLLAYSKEEFINPKFKFKKPEVFLKGKKQEVKGINLNTGEGLEELGED